MTPSFTLLGIETSCDETAAALVRVTKATMRGEILSNIVLSQIDAHAPYGGVVPEIAARAHLSQLDHIIRRALTQAQCDLSDIDAIAVTAGPGLIGGVMIGLTTAKALAVAAQKPLLAVNHLEGHALSVRLARSIAFPYLLLLVSGGHCQLLAVADIGDYRLYGSTRDDAVGEAFDKAAKLMGLGYPGGPAIEHAAQTGDANRFRLPRPFMQTPHCDFSFSGLKTALRQTAHIHAPLTEQDVADLAAAMQSAIIDCLRDRCENAFDLFRKDFPHQKNPLLVIAGGVAANKALRHALSQSAAQNGFGYEAAPIELCTDNAAMIAWAGAEYFARGQIEDFTAMLELPARARWPLAGA